jgi:hypothetical protein
MSDIPPYCPDPECGALLQLQPNKRVYRDSQTGRVLSQDALSLIWLPLLAAVPGLFIWIGTGAALEALFPSNTNLSLVRTVFGCLGGIAGIAVTSVLLAQLVRRRNAAFLQADCFVCYQCPRCGKQWMLKQTETSQTTTAEPGAILESETT